jgi:hypothetical protein
MGILARQSRLAKPAGAAAATCEGVSLLAEGAIDRHSQEALVVVVDDYDADTPLLAHGADSLA